VRGVRGHAENAHQMLPHEYERETTMKASTFLKDGNFIRKEDLERDGDRIETIADVEVTEFTDPKTGTERKLQLVLSDGVRLTLNATNTRVLVKHFGDNTEEWVGHAIVLAYDETVQYAGRTVGGIRVRVPRRPASVRPAAPPPAGPTPDDELSDDVPF
jgi:hypothetical protein